MVIRFHPELDEIRSQLKVDIRILYATMLTMEEDMGRRKKVKTKTKRYKIWSMAPSSALNTGPTDSSKTASVRLGANQALNSLARGEEIPQLRAKNFIFSAKAENQAAYERIYKTDRYRGINTYHHVALTEYSSEYFKYWLLFKGTRWVLMIDNTRDHIKSLSIVYNSREHVMFVLQQDRVVWHQRLDGADYNKEVEV